MALQNTLHRNPLESPDTSLTHSQNTNETVDADQDVAVSTANGANEARSISDDVDSANRTRPRHPAYLSFYSPFILVFGQSRAIPLDC